MTIEELAIKWMDLEVSVIKLMEECSNTHIQESMLAVLNNAGRNISTVLGCLEFDKINKTGRYD